MSGHGVTVPAGPAPEAAKPVVCRGECKGYFYTILNLADIEITRKPRGMSEADAEAALRNALTKTHPCEQDDNAKCAGDTCICQPIEVPTSGEGSPAYTKAWKEEITAHIRWIPTKDAEPQRRTVKGIISIVKYHGSGICRPDAEEPPYHAHEKDEKEE
jgi:hypothetical protein